MDLWGRRESAVEHCAGGVANGERFCGSMEETGNCGSQPFIGPFHFGFQRRSRAIAGTRKVRAEP
jgi:hypothetical protein